MKQETSLVLTPDIVRLMKQFTRLKIKPSAGLTSSEQELLMTLVLNADDINQPLTVTRISNLLQITPARVSHLLNPLEETGYIERLSDPKDRRIVRIGLTDKGAQEAAAVMADVQEKAAEMVTLLGEEDSQTLVRLLSRVFEHFSS
jgi:DNA-binding MarR family transcriptional regulator